MVIASVSTLVVSVTAASRRPPAFDVTDAASARSVAGPADPTVAPDSATVAHGVRYRAPLLGPLRVVRRFEPPPTPYAAGHRGVDLTTVSGQLVVAAGGGRVTFAGSVAGRGVVVVTHTDGITTEYEPVTPLVRAGASVRAGQVIALVRGTHHGCAPGACLHWGARRGEVYLDPLRLLSPLGPVRLLPWNP